MSQHRSARYELLDPLRGIAIIAVMLLHFCERGRDAGDALIHGSIWPVIQHGYLGVQLFFVISGYCITAALYGAMNKPQPFRYFMFRRIRRIFPPYWASLLLVILLGIATILVLKTPREVVFPLTNFDWLCNLLLIQGPLHAVDANVVYWSLSIEVQFYVVMALALFRPRFTELWLIGFSIFCLGLQHQTALPLSGTVMSYWPEFVCGIAAYYRITGRMRWKWTPAVLVGLVVLDIGLQAVAHQILTQPDGRFVKPVKLLFCLSCMALLLKLRPYDEVISESRPARLLAFFGLISYSLYLTHTPVGSRLFNLTDRLTGLQGLTWIPCTLAALLVSTGFGWLFFRWFEKPWLNPATAQPRVASQTLQEGVPT